MPSFVISLTYEPSSIQEHDDAINLNRQKYVRDLVTNFNAIQRIIH